MGHKGTVVLLYSLLGGRAARKGARSRAGRLEKLEE